MYHLCRRGCFGEPNQCSWSQNANLLSLQQQWCWPHLLPIKRWSGVGWILVHCNWEPSSFSNYSNELERKPRWNLMVVREYELMGLYIRNFGNMVQRKLARKCMFHPQLRLAWATKLRGFDSIQHFHTPNIARSCNFIWFLIS